MPSGQSTTRLPLNGVRVLDLGMFQAAPIAGMWLANAGAEVIKIESCSHPDNLRILARGVYPGGEAGERPWNRSGMINDRNRGKLGVTLEMGHEKGRALFRRLVTKSDVIVENFSTRVLPRWGFNYSKLREINPKIILASLYSQGGAGPESGYVSFGNILEQLGGLTYITGYPDELPGVQSVVIPDPLAGSMMVGLIVAALRQRRRTGEGTHIDLSQRENVTSVIGEVILDYSMNGRVTERMGNRDPHMAPHGCYACLGEDNWITIAVRDDEEWRNLCRAIDKPEMAEDERFETLERRHHHHNEIDSIISEWTRLQDKIQAMHYLQARGIAAGAVYTAADLYNDPHLKARSYWEDVEEPDAGYHVYPGSPFRLTKTPLTTRSPTPTLGEHNDYVFGELLGLKNEEIAELESDGVIGTEPTEAARRGLL